MFLYHSFEHSEIAHNIQSKKNNNSVENLRNSLKRNQLIKNRIKLRRSSMFLATLILCFTFLSGEFFYITNGAPVNSDSSALGTVKVFSSAITVTGRNKNSKNNIFFEMGEKMSEMKMYLSQYGWLENSELKNGSSALVDIRAAIREFQSFAGLDETGELDNETIELMGTPRCGVKDRVGHEAKRKKRYLLQGSRWKVNKLTYKITKYPDGLTKSDTDAEIQKAFEVWEKHTNLTFEKGVSKSGKVHIEIRFEKKSHGDGDPFDGEGGTLAHAYFPVFGGDAHFDDDEKWSLRSYKGTNLFQVAAHEFGHSLGLSHSDVKSALMAPFYRGYQQYFKLDEDDVNAIQQLYGKKEGTIQKTTTTTTYRPPLSKYPPNREVPPESDGETKPNENLCKNSKIDAISVLGDGETYVFKDALYYKLTDNGVAKGFPKRIREGFPGLPGFIDSAFTWKSNLKTYFFKGSQYWRFDSFVMDEGYPKNISEGFDGIPANIDAVFTWGGNGKIYFFKGSKYYKFDPNNKKTPVPYGYPKDISNWSGIPNYIDAVFVYTNGNTYFFKDEKYWRFNDKLFSVDEHKVQFPRKTAEWWFGCEQDKNRSSMKNGDKKSTDSLPDPSYISNDDSGENNGSGRLVESMNFSAHLIKLILIAILLSLSI